MGQLYLNNVRKNYGHFEVIKGVQLDIRDGEFVVFVGPSGCGKSTLLRMIAGLEDITAGDVVINGVKVNELPPVKRGIAMVFQSYALYPHMTVFENIAFPLRVEKMEESKIKEKVEGVAKILQLDQRLQQRPACCPVASASAWRSVAPSFASRRYSCLTSRFPTSMRHFDPICVSSSPIFTGRCRRR